MPKRESWAAPARCRDRAAASDNWIETGGTASSPHLKSTAGGAGGWCWEAPTPKRGGNFGPHKRPGPGDAPPPPQLQLAATYRGPAYLAARQPTAAGDNDASIQPAIHPPHATEWHAPQWNAARTGSTATAMLRGAAVLGVLLYAATVQSRQCRVDARRRRRCGGGGRATSLGVARLEAFTIGGTGTTSPGRKTHALKAGPPACNRAWAVASCPPNRPGCSTESIKRVPPPLALREAIIVEGGEGGPTGSATSAAAGGPPWTAAPAPPDVAFPLLQSPGIS